MLTFIKNKAATIGHNLSSLDNQPVGRAVLTILIFLDLFVLISIFDGLDEHTRQLTRPSQLIPQYCRDIVIDGEWNETNRMESLARIVSGSSSSYYYADEREAARERHSICEPVVRLVLSIEEDESLSDSLKMLVRTRQEIKQLNSKLARTKNAYDTALLEEIAGKETEATNVDSIKEDIGEKTSRVNLLVQKQALLDSALREDKRIKELLTIVENISDADRNDLRDVLRHLNFWYPLKRLGMEMIFLFPLFFIFYFWNARSIKTARTFQVLVSSHLLVVVFIPVFIKITELLYDIIPRKLLNNLIELLESLNLVAIWHYLMMAVVIIVALVVIYLFQKKLFSREKLAEKRISKGLCQNCGKHLPSNISACPFCGFEQYKQCGNCNKPTYVYGKFCRECGKSDIS